MSAYSAAILATTGLVAYWRLNDASPSATAADSSPSNFPAATFNISGYQQVGLLTGDADTCMAFNGTNSCVSRSAVTGLSTTVYSMECWFYQTRALNAAGSLGIAMSRGPTTAACDALVIRGTTGSTQGILSLFTGSHNETTGITAQNTRYHLVLTRNGNTVKVYLNGVKVLDASIAPTYTTSTRISFGASGDIQSPMQGRIDEGAVYHNVVLDQATISDHYNTGTGLFGVTGSVAGASASSGDVSATKNVAGSTVGSSATSGETVKTATLAGQITGMSLATADTTTTATLTGSSTGAAIGSSAAAGEVTVTVAATGSAAGASAAVGDPAITMAVTGSSSGASTSAAAALLSGELIGYSVGSSAAMGLIGIGWPLTGAAAGSSSASGAATATDGIPFVPSILLSGHRPSALTISAPRPGSSFSAPRPASILQSSRPTGALLAHSPTDLEE